MIALSKPILDDTYIRNIEAVIHSGQLAQGNQVLEFEKAFSNYIGTKHAIAVNSGTAALHVALLASGIQPGDEVITTVFSFIASSNAILMCGAKPVFVDIEPSTFNIDPSLISSKINPRTKAVIGVHLYGQTFEVDSIRTICKQYGLTLIEDACQAHGAEYKGQKAGSFGIGCFSFYPTKNMTTGEGGMVTTNDDNIADKCRLLRNHGQHERYVHTVLGYNYRMTEIGAVLGFGQLAKLDEFNAKRIKNAAFLNAGISKIPGLLPPKVEIGRKHVFHQFTIRVTENYPLTRDELKQHLETSGIGCAIHYPVPIHKQPLYQNLGYTDKLLIAEKASKEVLSIPVHPLLSQTDLDAIVEALSNV